MLGDALNDNNFIYPHGTGACFIFGEHLETIGA